MTLYEVAFWAKKAAYGFITLIVILIGCWIGRNFIEKVTTIINRPADEAPQNGYGVLAAVSIKSPLQLDDFTPQFSIETPSSFLPTFGEYNHIINVYKLEEKPRDLQSDQKGRDIATKLGFKSAPKITNDVIYSWSESGKSLTYNRQYGVFEYSVSALVAPSNQFSQKFDTNSSQAAATTLLTTIGAQLNYLDSNDTTNTDKISFKVDTEYVNYDFKNRVVTKAATPDFAPFVKLNVTRSIIVKNALDAKADILDNNNGTNIVSIIMRNQVNYDLGNIAQILFYDWNIKPTNGQTYKIITTEAAYNKLSTDKKTVISAKVSQSGLNAATDAVKSITKVRVIDAKLAYYQTTQIMTFTQPVYEFICEGTNTNGQNIDLIYLVPALE